MKKTVKMLMAMVMVVLMLSIATVPSMATGFSLDDMLNSIGTNSTADSDVDSFMNDVQDSFQGFFDDFNQQQQEFEQELADKQQEREDAKKEQQKWWDEVEKEHQKMETFVIVIIVIALLLLLAEIIYILIEAPKCGMTRFWALVPLFSNFFGLLVFIVIRSNRISTASNRTVVCPTCNGVHPLGTTECSICGTKLS